MNKRTAAAFAITFVGTAILTFGCQPTPAPSTAEETPTENVVVVVVTATSQPTLEATQPATEPSITPLPTLTPISGLGGTVTPSVAAATATKAARATATNSAVVVGAKSPTPTRPPNTVAPTAVPPTPVPQPTLNALKYPAVQLLGPSRAANNQFKDGDDIKFTFQAVGPLAANECYLLHAEMVNPALNAQNNFGDEFLDPNPGQFSAHCGDPSNAGATLAIVLYRGKFKNLPNYGTIEARAVNAAPTDILKMTWFVQVVQNNGLSDDGVHYNIVRLSPQSSELDFDFKP
jgi:hypothetical protein